MTIQKAAAAGVCAALIALQFKGGKTEYGIYVSIAAGLLLAAGILGKLDTVLATVREKIGRASCRERVYVLV